MTHDPFGTGALRRAVTEAWLASPTRFREDANSEEDHARGYYRDRVVVELAQNAADAAARAGVPGRLTLRVELVRSGAGPSDGDWPGADQSGGGWPGRELPGGAGAGADLAGEGAARDGGSDDRSGGPVWRLVAANTGAPLDADGVASLASLRASEKVGARSGAVAGAHDVVGRFGVGFAAVRSVSDEVLVRSRHGGVRFSLDATRGELGLAPGGDAGRDGAKPGHRRGGPELGQLLPPENEIGPLPRDRSIDGPISKQRTDVASFSQRATDLGAEATARGSALPVLRLPFPAPGTAPDEPDTVVELILRDAAAVAAVRAQLAALDDALLLALPALHEVEIEDSCADPQVLAPESDLSQPARRVLRDVGSRWRVHRASGTLAADETLPTEAQRPDWSVLWALPATGGRAAERSTLHAPTPTDVQLTFPGLLIASFPVDPGRRGVVPGPTTDRVAAEAGRAYAAFLGELGAERDVLGLVPTGLPAGGVDAAIRASADEVLRDTPLLRLSVPDQPAEAGTEELPGAAQRVRPRTAAFLAGPLGEDPVLARALAAGSPAALVTVPVRQQALARSLGAESLDLADLVEALPPEPTVVRTALDALAAHAGEPAVLEAIAGAQLPLADGRVTRGARGAVLLDTPHLAGIARTLGVRVVHPAAAHPLLERAGASFTTPGGLLMDPAVRSAALAAAEAVLDGDDADHLGRVLSGMSTAGPASRPAYDPGPAELVPADEPNAADTVVAVFELVRLATAEQGPDGLPFWLGELPVVADGDVVPLREAALPGTWAAQNLDLAQVRDDIVDRWGLAVLAAAGARADLGVYRVSVVLTADGDDPDYTPDDPAGWLSGWDEYLEHLADELGPGAWIADVEAVPDLDALRDQTGTESGERAPQPDPLGAALEQVSTDPGLRRALLTPVRSPDAPGRQAVSYTAWFLRRRLGAPFALRDTPLLPPAPPGITGLDDDLLTALGGLHSLAELPGRDWPAVLERMPAERQSVSTDIARAVWSGLAALARAEDAPAVSPDRLPAFGPRGVTVESTDDLAVAASPRWAQLGPVVPAPADVAEALADLLDLPYEDGPALVPDEPGELVELDPRVRALAPGAPPAWYRHERLTVGGTHVAWWVCEATGAAAPGVAHAVSPEGLARALAELTGVSALLLEAALRDPGRAEELSAELAWD